MKKDTSKEIKAIYELLFKKYGPQNWWPAKTAFEVIVGAILTQNTSWKNVEKAILSLKSNRLLNAETLYKTDTARVAQVIRSCGFFNIKARRLKSFLDYYISNHKGSIVKLRKLSAEQLRFELLQVNGIGKETADCIVLYAAEKPVFVVDRYTKRLLKRHGLITDKYDYDKTQKLFYMSLKKDTRVFNEYHALLVKVSKEHCKTKANCNGCPLESLLKGGTH